ncbi:hypothetical protein [Kitasatospora aureofaciens]|uniref:hypothetical protein n=1 Tax=Kitasatospora aureofaciens TaxID=1894 RepID=UPI0037C9B05F
MAGETWYRCLSGDTEAERQFLGTIRTEYRVETLASGPPEGYQAWQDSVGAAAWLPCRAEAPQSRNTLPEGSRPDGDQ